MPGRLGLIAGGGDLPSRLLDACRARGREVFVVALEGQAAPTLVGSDTPHAWARLGAAGRIVALLREAGVDELVMAGKVVRPSLGALRPDWRAIKFLAARGGRLGGDDDLLSTIIQAIEAEEGIRVVSAASLLADLPAPHGALGRHRPSSDDVADIALGLAAARRLGELDIGQAAVVQQGSVLALEDEEGTDVLVERAGVLQQPGRGAILVKVCKPQQEVRADPPVIGPETIRRAAAAGFAGIAVDAGGTLVLDRAEVVRLADAAGLFVVGIDAA
jgi:DUF1009 family protein